MARTYDEADREEGDRRRRERQEERFDVDSRVGSRVDIGERRFRELFRAFGERADEIESRRREAADQFREGTEDELRDSIGIDLGDIEGDIIDLIGEDFSALDQRELLEVLANQANNALSIFLAMTTQFSGLAALITDVANNTQDPFGIAVSGVNDIDDPGVEQPVVRGSDDREINARVFRVRASESNTSTIWIGDDNVSVREGFPLKPGEELPINIQLAEDQIYMVSEERGQEVEIIGLV